MNPCKNVIFTHIVEMFRVSVASVLKHLRPPILFIILRFELRPWQNPSPSLESCNITWRAFPKTSENISGRKNYFTCTLIIYCKNGVKQLFLGSISPRMF